MNDIEKNFISAVIYVHNAEERIEQFLKTIIDVLEENFEKSEIICVNDSSDDDSIQVIKNACKYVNSTTVSVLNMSYFHGLEAAMNAGVDLSIGDFVLEFDSTLLDFQKEEIMKVYKKSIEGYDIVSTSPDRKQKLSSNLFYYIFEKFANLNYKMHSERFRVLSRRAINRVGSINNSVSYRKATYANCGLKIVNMKYNVILHMDKCDKDKKESSYRKGLAIDTLILFTEIGYGFSMLMTMLMMSIAFLMGIYSLLVYFTSTPVVGWTTTILFMSFAFFGLFGVLTVIIKYLSILVNLVFKRKRYSFESIEKLTK